MAEDVIASLRLDLDFRPMVDGSEKSKQALAGVGAEATKTQATLAGLSPTTRQLAQEYERLRTQVRSGALGMAEYLVQQQKILDQLARSGQASTQAARAQEQQTQSSRTYASAVANEITALKGLGAEQQLVAAQQQRLIELQARLAVATQAATQSQSRQIAAYGNIAAAAEAAAVAQGKAAQVSQYGNVASAAERVAIGQAKVAQSTAAATISFDKLRGPAQAALIALSGLPGPAGRFVGTLGLLVGGSGVGIVAVAVVAALAIAWDKYSKAAREAEERTKSLRQELTKQREDRTGVTADQASEDLRAEIRRLEARAASEERIRYTGSRFGTTEVTGGFVSARTQAELDKALADFAEFARNIGKLAAEAGDAWIERMVLEPQRREQRRAEEQRRLFEERKRQLHDLAQAESAAQGDTGSIAHRSINAQVEAATRLNAAEKERLRTALLTVAALEQQQRGLERMAPLLEKLNAAAAEGVDRGPLGFQRQVIAGDTRVSSNLDSIFSVDAARELVEEAARLRRAEAEAIRDQIDAMEAGRQAAIGFAVEVAGVDQSLGRALSAMSGLVNANDRAAAAEREHAAGLIDTAELQGRLAEAAQQARLALASVIAALGQMAFQGESSADVVGRGVFGGISAGLSVGGPLGILAGLGTALSGIFNGLSGASEAARAEARRMEEAKRAWRESFEGWADAGLSTMQKESRRLQSEFEAILEKLFTDYGYTPTRPGQVGTDPRGIPQSFDEVAALRDTIAAQVALIEARGKEAGFLKEYLAVLDEYIAKEQEAARLRQQELGFLAQDLTARAATAQGRTDEAATLQLLADQERERLALIERYGDELPEVIRLQLEQTQALEREALAREQNLATMRKTADALDFEGQLRVREQALKGDDLATQIAGYEEAAAAERRRAQIMLEAGDITVEQFNRLIAVIGGEFVDAVNAATQAVQDMATSAAQETSDRFADRQYRNFKSEDTFTGGHAAEDFARGQKNQDEINAYIKAGAEAWEIAALIVTQANEEAAIAYERNAEQVRKNTEALAAQARILEDWDVRFLRSQGNNAAADQRQFDNDTRDQADAARKAGVSPEQIDWFTNVLRPSEWATFMAGQQQGSAAGASGGPGGGSVAGIAGGITESTGSTIQAYLASTNIYASFLPQIAAHTAAMAGGALRTIAPNVGAIAPNTQTAAAGVGNVVNLILNFGEGDDFDEFSLEAHRQLDRGLDAVQRRRQSRDGTPRRI